VSQTDLGAHLLAEDDDRCDHDDNALDVVADGVSDGRHGIKGKESSLVVELPSLHNHHRHITTIVTRCF
jgi:hypothetical protein